MPLGSVSLEISGSTNGESVANSESAGGASVVNGTAPRGGTTNALRGDGGGDSRKRITTVIVAIIFYNYELRRLFGRDNLPSSRRVSIDDGVVSLRRPSLSSSSSDESLLPPIDGRGARNIYWAVEFEERDRSFRHVCRCSPTS